MLGRFAGSTTSRVARPWTSFFVSYRP